MSDDYTADTGGEIAEGGVPDSGGDADTDATPEAPPEYFDADQYAGHHVRLKVDGEELDVPLSEALQGYSRTADYTRKTQALAEQQRQAQYAITLAQALENNPQATMRLLQEQYGIAATPQSATEEDDDWLADPTDLKLREYDERIQQFESYKADQELQTALRVLQQQFGDDFDPNAVVGHAVATGRMDLANIHKEMMFDRQWQQRQAQAEAERRRATDEAKRTAAKAGMTPHQGGGASAASVERTPSDNAPSIADAYYAAKQQLGL
jgi:hypothetical protein